MTSTDTRGQILQTIDRLGKASVTDIVKSLPMRKSRQWVSMLLTDMHKQKQVARAKSGKFVFYVLPHRLDLIGKRVSRKMSNTNINEDSVFDDLSSSGDFIKALPENINSMLRYGFTEMVNNVAEHSASTSLEVFIEETDKDVTFGVSDNGIGVFRNIMQKKHLDSELEAIQELLKGKTTTLPHSHSGEGIFFTSKVADIFILESFGHRLRIDNTIPDIFIEKIDAKKGTNVFFQLNKHTKKHLSDVFYEYQAEPGSYAFDKTKVHVKLFTAGTVYISRSQAKRLMANLDKFSLVILDFEGIKTVGQAFADEVFRVFAANHPKVKVEPINMSETVEFMIRRVDKADPQAPPR